MTNVSTRVPAQSSSFHGTVASLFSLAILVMAGVVAFTAFASV
jgi:hypothetical protein